MAHGSRRSDWDAFLANPCGRSVGTSHALLWFPRRDLRVVAFRARPTPSDVAIVLQAALAVREWMVPSVSILDIRRVEGVAPGILEYVAEFETRHAHAFVTRVVAAGIVHGGGGGALVALGCKSVLCPHLHVTMHTTLDDALHTTGAGGDGRTLGALIESEFERLAAGRETRDRVCTWLADHLHDAPVQACARTLHMPARTLQRRLRAEGTTYLRELQGARVARAMELLTHTDWKVAAIAAEVGYPTIRGLSLAFQAILGQTPSAFRKRAERTRAPEVAPPDTHDGAFG